MLAGFFPTRVSFRGTFRFGAADELAAALAAIQELVDGEEDELAADLVLEKKGCELRVRVATTCARDEYLAYETLIETLATFAIAGEVVGEIDDTITSYPALGDQPHTQVPSVVSKAAGLVAWIPLLASDTMLDLSVVLA